MKKKEKIFAIIPASGLGKRMHLSIPKQYICIKKKL
ncbi:2-C-methyl-D-erythritol 4-phosphate cytidylyltransferase [bacterium endosymbiont of Pedicinus badii]|nr:2-C-methyl-D-erythritol 4-phosphate cytidylyltransferase [bacterium endosymbiont of Pedicinus badii]